MPRAPFVVAIGWYLGWVLLAALYSRKTQLQPDEGFEFAKAAVYAAGEQDQLWNDQLPTWSIVLGWLIANTGPSPEFCRILSACISGLLLAGLSAIAGRRGGVLAGMIAPAFLLSCPGVFGLLLSVTLEPICFSLAIVSLVCLILPSNGRHLSISIGAGLLMGAAMAIKLVASLYLPAQMVVILRRSIAESEFGRSDVGDVRKDCMRAILAIGLFATVCFSTLALIVTWADGQSLLGHLRMHQDASGALGKLDAQSFRLQWSLVLGELPVQGLCLFAVIGLVAYRRHDISAFVLLSLATVSLVHMFHRPFWLYYRLHFFIPIAIAGGLGFGYVSKKLLESETGWLSLARSRAIGILLVLVVSSVVCEIAWQAAILEGEENWKDNRVVRLLRGLPEGRTGFCRNGSLMVFGGLRPLPVLAVLPAKRFWTGEINEAGIARDIDAAEVDVLILGGEQATTEWRDLLESEYVRVQTVGNYGVFARIRSQE